MLDSGPERTHFLVSLPDHTWTLSDLAYDHLGGYKGTATITAAMTKAGARAWFLRRIKGNMTLTVIGKDRHAVMPKFRDLTGLTTNSKAWKHHGTASSRTTAAAMPTLLAHPRPAGRTAPRAAAAKKPLQPPSTPRRASRQRSAAALCNQPRGSHRSLPFSRVARVCAKRGRRRA
ncbi:hypothetical protein BC828DRAFT_417766 [Blastocladiella britannica]|nr:hypothetical protein BC828DRAFT_417766 [Blastocladiella britannica]